MTDRELSLKSYRLRRRMLRLIADAGAGHTGGGLSCIDILNVLYNRVLRVAPEAVDDPSRDRFVQSKGHCVEALYAVMSDRGYFPDADLSTVCHYESSYVGHPTRKVRGMEMNTGALGHGLPICVGMALAARMDGATHREVRRPLFGEMVHAAATDGAAYRVFTLLGDGEIAEGSNWEAAMAASHHKLDNLVAILDHNSLQITGRTRDVMSNEPLDEKWRAFGWEVRSIDGHDYTALTTALTTPPAAGKPLFIIAKTVKGKGVSFMENVGKWHHGVPSDAELAQALAELSGAELRLREASA